VQVNSVHHYQEKKTGNAVKNVKTVRIVGKNEVTKEKKLKRSVQKKETKIAVRIVQNVRIAHSKNERPKEEVLVVVTFVQKKETGSAVRIVKKERKHVKIVKKNVVTKKNATKVADVRKITAEKNAKQLNLLKKKTESIQTRNPVIKQPRRWTPSWQGWDF